MLILWPLTCSVFEAERPGYSFSIQQRLGSYLLKVIFVFSAILIVTLQTLLPLLISQIPYVENRDFYTVQLDFLVVLLAKALQT